MNKFSLYKGTGRTNQQISRPLSSLRSLFLFCIGCLLAAILMQEDRWIFIGVALLVLFYGLLTTQNDRVTYNETGITLYSVWGKPFHKSWRDIQNIDIVEESLISKQLLVGRVLRIECKEKDGACTTYRFPYRYYIGIDDFLSFSTSYYVYGYEQRKENDP